MAVDGITKPGFLAKDLYVIQTWPMGSHEHVKAQMAGHLAHQAKLEKDGILFGAGPLFEPGSERPAGGMIIVRAHSFDDAKAIADSDPMHASGARSYKIQRWRLNEGRISLTVTYSDQSVAVT